MTLKEELEILRGEPIEVFTGDPMDIPCIETSDPEKLCKHPVVSVNMITYNHEPYIRQAIEGVMMQKTDFEFELVIGEDCSQDKTREICFEFQKKYPDKIRVLWWHENVSKFGGNGRRTRAHCRGEFIALCEGDDYWTDPLKLQKQVDFLEENEEYIVCFHRCKNLIQRTGEFTQEFVKDMPGESTIIDLAKENYIHTPSVVYRRDDRIIIDRSKLPADLAVGDYVNWMLLAQYGKIMKFPEEMAVYRYGVGVWSAKPLSYTAPRWCNVLIALIEYFENTQPQISEILKKQMFDTLESSLKAFEVTYSQMEGIQNSRAYRLGKFLLKPFSMIRRLVIKMKP